MDFEKKLMKKSPLKGGSIQVEDESVTYRPVDKITKRIWLGDYTTAKNKDFFKKNNIKAVLNCTKDVQNTFKTDESIEYLRIPVDDSLQEVDFKKMYYYFPIIIEFLNKTVNIEKKNVLVHCVQGKARSCIALAVFLVNEGMKPEEALEYILKKRPDAFFFGTSINFNKSFVKFLKNYEFNKLPKY